MHTPAASPNNGKQEVQIVESVEHKSQCVSEQLTHDDVADDTPNVLLQNVQIVELKAHCMQFVAHGTQEPPETPLPDMAMHYVQTRLFKEHLRQFEGHAPQV